MFPNMYPPMHQTHAVEARSASNRVRDIAKSLRLVVLACVIGALGGALLSVVIHPRWVGRMTVQLGQISIPADNAIASRLVESQSAATVRYNLPSFRTGIIEGLGLPDPESTNPQSTGRESRLLFNSMLVSSERSPDLINLQVSAYSRDQAKAALLASFNAISSIHQKIFDPALSDMKGQLESTSTKLAEAEDDYTRAYKAIRTTTGPGDTTASNSRDVLVTNMATLINTQILDLRKQTVLLREAMSPMLTYPTRIVEAPYVPVRPSTPSRGLLIAAGALLGLLVGGAYAARGYFRKR
jgi:hypothetical protein